MYLTLAETIILTFGVVDDGRIHQIILFFILILAGITGFLLREGSLTKEMASLVSYLISIAVFLSYPLQLYPALQVDLFIPSLLEPKVGHRGVLWLWEGGD